MDRSNGFRSRDFPLVLCIGTTPQDLTAVLAATGGRVPVVYLPDANGLREVFTEPPPEPRLVEYGKLRLDAELREATWRGKPIRLSARDFDLLFVLTHEPGRVRTFADLTRRVWGRTYVDDTDAVVSAVKRLRHRLRAAAAGVHVASVRGIGYRLVIAGEDAAAVPG